MKWNGWMDLSRTKWTSAQECVIKCDMLNGGAHCQRLWRVNKGREGREVKSENAIPTENRKGKGSEEAHSPKNRAAHHPRHPHRHLPQVFYTCNAQTPSPVTSLSKTPSQSRPGRWVVMRRFREFLETNRRSHCACPLGGIPARNCDASPLPSQSLRPLAAPCPLPVGAPNTTPKKEGKAIAFFRTSTGMILLAY